ncbi:hypothetical protein BDV23DRAFT_193465 [Aspergillus alliaceus]|uniref:Cellobiose dehydrogenase cytochrome domain-containing protein n=1 Tax=Petromyces alliaceus TaxID=209559 RepID=A0A5N7CB47_PETAA|nr:hypothetical protein BDV23DRAFT_193465 [Aspergillus alliaceus]
MYYSSLAFLAVSMVLVPCIWGQIIIYMPSKGGEVSYGINIPEHTGHDSHGAIYLQLNASSHMKWALGHFGVFHDPTIQAYLLEGSGVHDDVMTANIRCDSCMQLNNGDSILGSSSSWGWATSHVPLVSGNVFASIHKRDNHGIFTLNFAAAIGGDSLNPFSDSTYPRIGVRRFSKQHQTNDAIIYRKRVAHGVMTPAALVLWFPGFALLCTSFYLAILLSFLALAGLGFGVSLCENLRQHKDYHQFMGYVSLGGGRTSLYDISHRWLGRVLLDLSIISGGIRINYTYQNTYDIQSIAPMIYGVLCGGLGMFYIFVIIWSRGE